MLLIMSKLHCSTHFIVQLEGEIHLPLGPGIERAVEGAVFVRVKLVWAKTSDTLETANRTAVIAADFIEKECFVVVNEVKTFETA
jgi:hypothetical protein